MGSILGLAERSACWRSATDDLSQRCGAATVHERDHWSPEGAFTASGLMIVVGIAEIGFGLLALAVPVPGLLLFVAAWKVFTELLRSLAGENSWECVERASNMVAPLYVEGARRQSI